MSEPETVRRPVASVQAPAARPLDHDKLFPKSGARVDLAVLKEHLRIEGRLHLDDVFTILDEASAIFRKEPNLLELNTALTICGDVHGQYYDLIRLIDTVGGDPAETTYLFLGDYVDRGHFSVEVVLLLWAYKIVYPNTFYLLRGNHECRHLTDYFTFKEECRRKYGPTLYDRMMDAFDCLPLAALMNKQFLCVHGGISPSIKTLDDIRTIERFQETPQSGAMCDLMWADPIEEYEEDAEATFTFNEARGCSYAYGYRAVCNFLEANDLLSLIRAHEAQDDGYKMHKRHDKTGFPTVITLFSAPNYLDAYGNKAAVMRYENNVMNIRQFHHSDHPYWLPNFMDVFTWSMPFVSEKVAEILLTILKLCDEADDEGDDNALSAERREQLKAKVRSVTKLMRMYNTLTQEREAVLQLKGLTDRGTLPPGVLSGGAAAIKESIGDFKQASKLDRENERRPAFKTARPTKK